MIEFKDKLKFNKEYECVLVVLLGYGMLAGSPHITDENKIIVTG